MLVQIQLVWLLVGSLKYGFCNKVISERWNSDELNTFTTYLSSLLGVIAEYNSNHAQKWGQICCKSVQLVRVSSFRNDLLQNPYFSRICIQFFLSRVCLTMCLKFWSELDVWKSMIYKSPFDFCTSIFMHGKFILYTSLLKQLYQPKTQIL